MRCISYEGNYFWIMMIFGWGWRVNRKFFNVRGGGVIILFNLEVILEIILNKKVMLMN